MRLGRTMERGRLVGVRISKSEKSIAIMRNIVYNSTGKQEYLP